MNEPATKFDAWALVELFGHQRIVGRVSEQTIGGGAFIRVDVPDAEGKTRFTRFYGHAAIYAISPIDQATAISLAQAVDAEPVRPYELPKLTEGSAESEDL
jgi:hypothetical protein